MKVKISFKDITLVKVTYTNINIRNSLSINKSIQSTSELHVHFMYSTFLVHFCSSDHWNQYFLLLSNKKWLS